MLHIIIHITYYILHITYYIYIYINMYIYIPTYGKPRVAAWSFVHKMYERKSVHCKVEAHLDCSFARICVNCIVFVFSSSLLCGFFLRGGLACPKIRGCTACLLVIFPHLPVEIATVFAMQRLAYSLRCCFQHGFFTHVDVMQLPRACVHYTNSLGLRVVNPPLT